MAVELPSSPPFSIRARLLTPLAAGGTYHEPDGLVAAVPTVLDLADDRFHIDHRGGQQRAHPNGGLRMLCQSLEKLFGRHIHAKSGQTIIQAAAAAGIGYPDLCARIIALSQVRQRSGAQTRAIREGKR